MRTVLYEHNTLNGFRFVLVEFGTIALAALFMAAAAVCQGSVVWPAAWGGVAINAVAVCATALQQIRRGERSHGLVASFSREGRARILREHPRLGRHTLQIVGAALVPYLLALLTLFDRPRPGRGGAEG